MANDLLETLTVANARTQKLALEQFISRTLDDFSATTGLKVKGLELTIIQPIGQAPIYEVKVRAEI